MKNRNEMVAELRRLLQVSLGDYRLTEALDTSNNGEGGALPFYLSGDDGEERFPFCCGVHVLGDFENALEYDNYDAVCKVEGEAAVAAFIQYVWMRKNLLRSFLVATTTRHQTVAEQALKALGFKSVAFRNVNSDNIVRFWSAKKEDVQELLTEAHHGIEEAGAA